MSWDMFGGTPDPSRSKDVPSYGRGRTPAIPMPIPRTESFDPLAGPLVHSMGVPPPGPQVGPSSFPSSQSSWPGGFGNDYFPPHPVTSPQNTTQPPDPTAYQSRGQSSSSKPTVHFARIPRPSGGASTARPTSHADPTSATTKSHAHTTRPTSYIQTTSAPAPTSSKSHLTKPKPSASQAVLPPASPSSANPTFFQYSRCSGKRKAVCVGINYFKQPYELYGCVNDAKNVYRFLNKSYNFKEENMALLVDDSKDPRQHPTRQNIINAMRWLVKDAKSNDSLFFHYSGHGGQVKDLDGDEIDGWDEVIYPLDYQKAGSIVDDLIHSIMVKPLPVGCRLTALFDSCHSGSILDLPYLYHTNGRVKGSQVHARHFQAKSTPADVISWSGCKDSQKSADVIEGGVAAGAMSHAFMSSLRLNPHQTYQELLRSVREILKKKYSQKPQLSSSHRIDTNLQFII